MSRRLAGPWSGLACALLIACASRAAPPRPQGPVALQASSALPGFRPIWVNTALHPVAQPIAVGPALLGIVVDGRRLLLIGIDPATGALLWQQAMSYGDATPAVAAAIVPLGEDRVAYLRPYPDDSDLAHLVVADARTGRDLAVSPPHSFAAPPHPCANGKDVCAISHGNGAGREHPYRLVVAKDDYRQDGDALLLGVRALEVPDLLDVGDRPGDTLGWLRDGKIQWRTPVSAALPPAFSSGNGWVWQRFADQQVLVGSVFGPVSSDGGGYRRDLPPSSATAGLSERTGEVLWRDTGSTLYCRVGAPQRAVRCRWRGTVAIASGGGPSLAGLQVTVEGFDPATGKTTWEAPLGAAESLVTGRAPIVLAGATEVVVTGADGPVVLDTNTGALRPPVPGATYWCMTAADWRSASGARRADGIASSIAAVCDEHGRPSTGLPGPEATIAAGARIGDRVVVAASRGYVGFKLR